MPELDWMALVAGFDLDHVKNNLDFFPRQVFPAAAASSFGAKGNFC